MKNRATIIIGFYKRVDQLELILESLKLQTEADFEVCIADDGSPQNVVDEIEKLKKKSNLKIKHVWHEDKGFRKTTVLNRAIKAADSNCLIFIDGDCILERHFIEDHLRFQKSKRVVLGRRVELSERLSLKITKEFIRKRKLEKLNYSALLDSLWNKSRKAEAGFRTGIQRINLQFADFRKGILGCNFSMQKEDLVDLNGFDERYKHAGVGEDTELTVRTRNAGFELFKPKFALVQFHLWHKKLSRAMEKENLKLLEESKRENYTATPYGLK